MEKDIKVVVLMITMKFGVVIILTLILTFSPLFAIYVGLYQGKVWIDVPLHIFGGVILALLGIFISKEKHLFFNIFLFSVGGSILWEVFEFTLWSFLPTIATTFKLYSPTFSDAASDILAGFVGGIMAMLTVWKRKVD